jgi:RES domain-containing protein
MLVYRLSKSKYRNDLEGIGAKLYGGRWNNIGTPCIYTSENRSLAILEYASNVELDQMPRALHFTVYDIPEKEFVTIEVKNLPGNWKDAPSPQSTKDFGSDFFKDSGVLGIRIPSAIVPEEYNFLINPAADKFSAVRVVDSKDFIFDVRIKNKS